jgi:hypothetical protein
LLAICFSIKPTLSLGIVGLLSTRFETRIQVKIFAYEAFLRLRVNLSEAKVKACSHAVKAKSRPVHMQSM